MVIESSRIALARCFCGMCEILFSLPFILHDGMCTFMSNSGFNLGADIGLLLDDDGLSGLGIGDQLSTDNKRKYSYIVTGIVSAIIVAFSWVLFTIWTYMCVSTQHIQKQPFVIFAAQLHSILSIED